MIFTALILLYLTWDANDDYNQKKENKKRVLSEKEILTDKDVMKRLRDKGCDQSQIDAL